MAEFGDSRLPQRFWKNVQKSGECWMWTGRDNGTGYGALSMYKQQPRLAHRLLFTVLVRLPADGMVLDHVCRNKRCVNPAHLDEVTQLINVRRGKAGQAQRERTHCPHGHPYDAANTYVGPNGKRQCRECRRIQSRPSEQRKRAGLPPGRQHKSQV